jgi:hypothetical protein
MGSINESIHHERINITTDIVGGIRVKATGEDYKKKEMPNELDFHRSFSITADKQKAAWYLPYVNKSRAGLQ